LADSAGLGLGVVFGEALIGTTGNYRALFVVDGISFVVFFAIVYVAIAETGRFDQYPSTHMGRGKERGWG
jgi:hypothetical protein